MATRTRAGARRGRHRGDVVVARVQQPAPQGDQGVGGVAGQAGRQAVQQRPHHAAVEARPHPRRGRGLALAALAAPGIRSRGWSGWSLRMGRPRAAGAPQPAAGPCRTPRHQQGGNRLAAAAAAARQQADGIATALGVRVGAGAAALRRAPSRPPLSECTDPDA